MITWSVQLSRVPVNKFRAADNKENIKKCNVKSCYDFLNIMPIKKIKTV